MNSFHTQNSAPDAMDHLLAAHFASDEKLAPSSGFALSVMESIQAEATAPPPIAFPWRRVVPGLVAVAALIIAACIYVVRDLRTAYVSGALFTPVSAPQMHLTPLEQALCWIAASTCVSLLVAAASVQLAKR